MNLLYNHNLIAYKKVKEELKTKNKTCIVHTTGSGKSFIALQLMIDFLEENPNKHICYVTPLNGIKNQILNHIEKSNIAENTKKILENVEFTTYQSLTTKSKKELNETNIDLLILDEFHHLGAKEWTKAIEQIVSSHPNLKIFGMSATSVRERGTSNQQDISETFFEGNIASTYDLSNAIADGVLPAPNYHAALTFLEDECEELEERIKNGKASAHEKEQYNIIIKNIKHKISMMEEENIANIIRKYIKPNGKYIYFCSKIYSDTDDTIETIQNNFLKILPEELRENTEIYQVHSTNYTEKQNKENHYNFYHNITSDGKDAKEKLKIMFAIDMYNEGIHVPDIDGVIMGRSTKSEIIFYQQLGRALAVNNNENKNDNQPLIIDLMDNFRQILNLYKKTKKLYDLKTTINKNNEKNNHNEKNYYNLIINFGINDEIIDIVEEIDSIKEKIKLLDFEEKINELYKYIEINGILPTEQDKMVKFSDGTYIYSWLRNFNSRLQTMQETDMRVKKIVEEFNKDKRISFEEKINEAYTYLKQNQKLPLQKDKTAIFSDGTLIGSWLVNSKEELLKIKDKNVKAKAIIEELKRRKGLNFEEKINEVYNYFTQNNELPYSQNQLIKFSDNTSMGVWIYRYKKELKKIKDKDIRVRIIIENVEKRENLDFEEKVNEVYLYLKNNKKLPSQKEQNALFSDNTLMGNWLSKNYTRLKKNNDNEQIKIIVEEIEKNKRLSFNEKLEEIYNYLQIYNELPKKSNTNIKFSDGHQMGIWLSSNKKKIIEQQENNELARIILEEIKKKSNLSNEEKIEEIHDYLINHHKLPSKKDKLVKFSDGTGMYKWLSRSKKYLIEKSLDDQKILSLIKLIIMIKPNYFDNAIKTSDKQGQIKIVIEEIKKQNERANIIKELQIIKEELKNLEIETEELDLKNRSLLNKSKVKKIGSR